MKPQYGLAIVLLALALAPGAALTQEQEQEQEQAPPSGPSTFPEVVARVNGAEISKAQLLRRADAIRAQIQQVGPDFYQRVLDDLVGAELLYQSGLEKGLVPTEAELDAELGAQAERFGGQEAFDSALASEGLSLDEVRVELKKELAIQSLIERDFVPKVAVSEEAKRAFYEENASQMQRPMQFRVAHILIGTEDDATAEQKEEARKKAASLRSMAEAGQDFGELAQRNSDDPGSKDNGGELPWMSQGQTVPPFEAAALALAPGEMSDVVETQYGYHVIKMLERREAGPMSYEEVSERIEEFLKRRGLQEQLQDAVDTLRAEGQVEIFI